MAERDETQVLGVTDASFRADPATAQDRKGDFVNETFTNQSFLMDESSFDGCRMVGCTLKFGGQKRPHMMNCSLKAPKIVFVDAAQTTLRVLIDLGQSGYPVEFVFGDIRRAIADNG